MPISIRNIMCLCLLLVQIFASAQTEEIENSNENDFHHCLFKKGSLTIGSGTSYSLNHEIIGLNLRTYYNWGEKWCLGPEISILQSNEITISEVSIVGHYIFETHLVGIFPLLGANYTQEKESEHLQSGFGIVYGIGIHRNFKQFGLFAEYATVEGKIKDHFFNAGLIYTVHL